MLEPFMCIEVVARLISFDLASDSHLFTMSGTAVPGKPRRRDRFLQPFKSMSRHPSMSDTSHTSTSSTGQSSNLSFSKVSTTSIGQIPAHTAALPILSQVTPTLLSTHDIWKNVLEKLSEQDRVTLDVLNLSRTSDITVAVKQALDAAEQKQRDCNQKGWICTTFAGHTIIWGEQFDKIVQWLDRFKSVGDVAVNANPVYAGLPWAAIRFLLEVRICIIYMLYQSC